MSTETAQDGKTHNIHPCNFRYAGRLSNENARTLTQLHERLAANVTNALEVFLAAALPVKLVTLEQMAVQDYQRTLPQIVYLLPVALNIMESSFLLQMDAPLVFPVIDLLLGGAGVGLHEVRELTEIEEELMQSVSGLLVQQLERAWRTLELSLTPAHPIKPGMISQIFPANEKLVLFTFDMEAGGVSGNMKLVLPTSFVGYLLRHLRATQSRKRLSLRRLPNPSFRERILESVFTTSMDVTEMRVLVRDLVELGPGSILRMKAPVKTPGHVTVDEVAVFEAAPVRSGPRKAAQLMGRSAEPSAMRDSL